MPYIEVEELPEGVEEASVVSRADYDAVVAERDSTIAQRDDALTQIREAQNREREAKAKYAQLVLDSAQHQQSNPEPEPPKEPKAKPITSASLFD